MHYPGKWVKVPKSWLQSQIMWSRAITTEIRWNLPKDINMDLVEDTKNPRYLQWLEGMALSDAAESFIVFDWEPKKPRVPREKKPKGHQHELFPYYTQFGKRA
jgi:hypothetical protein